MKLRTRNIISKTIHIEGGYVNDPDDIGGETNHGISKHSFPQEDIKNMTFERAIQIGYTYFWFPLMLNSYRCDGYAWKCFDIAFNCGQQALTLVETVVSPDFLDTPAGIDDLIRSLDIHYHIIIEQRLRSKKWLNGWETRARMKYSTGEKYYA